MKFKVGDKVRKIKGIYSPYIGIIDKIGLTYIEGQVTNIIGNPYLKVGDEFGDFPNYYELVESAAEICTGKLTGEPVAKKEISGKPPLSWIPYESLEPIAQALAFGSQKYDYTDEQGILRRNFKRGLNWSLLIDATLRHMFKFAMGENLDIDDNCQGCKDKNCKTHSGLPHPACACANIIMLLYNYNKKIGTDDR